MSIRDINFDDIDMSKYQPEIDEINKSLKKLSKSKRIQKMLSMYNIEKSLGFHDNRKLKIIKIKDNSLEFIFKDKTSTVITIKDLIKLYNYNKK